MKKALSLILLCAAIFACFTSAALASTDENDIYGTNNGADSLLSGAESLKISAKSAFLVEAETGAVLYSKNADEPLPPASVTKIMTLLLVAEAIDRGAVSTTDRVTVSARAAEMGGSQIFLKEGEEFTVEELLKSAVIASANDAAVALAELVSGSEEAFVTKMNERAAELGMKSTVFENATGLDDTVTKHLTSARDIAIMSRELLKHDIILSYSKVWQDSIRDGEFILTNTNRLVRYYSGCTGLKTGSTDKAGFCISASAKRGDMHLIAVIMGAETRDVRNAEARSLLDFGFAGYEIFSRPVQTLGTVKVKRGIKSNVGIAAAELSVLVPKGDSSKIKESYMVNESVDSPVKAGDEIGYILYTKDGKEIARRRIYATEESEEISLVEIFIKIFKSILLGKCD